ncbi:MAG: helix-turn-helix domain-containing protein [Clostridiales bacterium]|nr:helix-turn-helix domain-containing protein [Clostridiales bacterium]
MIERADHRSRFTRIDNGIPNDRRLSLRAMGLMLLALSRPDDWKFSVRGLAALCADGKASVNAALNELQEAGYLEVIQNRTSNGKMSGNEFTFRERPQAGIRDTATEPQTESRDTATEPQTGIRDTATEPQTESRDTATEPHPDLPDTGKRALLTNISTNDVSTNECVRFTPPTVGQVRDYCQGQGYSIDPERFVDYYEARGWMLGKSKMKNWQAAVRNWSRKDRKTEEKPPVRDSWQLTDPSTWRF